ncbi:hypothetical protein BofuT4_P022740.1 [Botrytis cinerea T4]|uniref:Uncharacterized protein n=1 Tax=Botryotinia fuckeliana (strain T4) TaxID=999810 RepID=G2YGX2_BOTF4|nr:hypothetical protein BofuT4_P022740.1 [Botrytis cinerea T4]
MRYFSSARFKLDKQEPTIERRQAPFNFGLRWREANVGAIVVVEGESRGICQTVTALANILGSNSLNVQSLPRLQNKVNYTLKEKLHDIPTQAHGHLVIEILCVVLTTD